MGSKIGHINFTPKVRCIGLQIAIVKLFLVFPLEMFLPWHIIYQILLFSFLRLFFVSLDYTPLVSCIAHLHIQHGQITIIRCFLTMTHYYIDNIHIVYQKHVCFDTSNITLLRSINLKQKSTFTKLKMYVFQLSPFQTSMIVANTKIYVISY